MNLFRKIFSIVSAISPALGIYYIMPGITLDSFLLWSCLIPIIIINYQKIQLDKCEVNFILCILIISGVSSLIHIVLGSEWFDFTLFCHNIYSIVLHLVPLIFVVCLIDASIFVKAVLIFGVIASLVLIWQWLSLFFTGSFQKDVFISWLDMKRDVEGFAIIRPSSFFTEPAHFSIYVLPAVQIALQKSNKILIFLFSFALICSTSTTGLILLIVLFVYQLYEFGLNKWYRSLFFSIIMILSIYFLQYFVVDIYDEFFYKLESIKYGDGAGSGRLLGPLEYLSVFNFYEHFFGITLNQLTNLMIMNHIFGYGNYANALIYSYISFGIIGFITFINYLKKRFYAIEKSYGFFLIFIGIIVSDQILFNCNYFYLASFVLLSNKICKKENECI